jgi:hypothetical protein
MSNKEWESPADGDARITKMKDGRTHLAHKTEHAVDLDTGAVVAVTLQAADLGDTVTLDATLSEAGMAVAELVKREVEQRPEDTPKVNVEGVEEVVADSQRVLLKLSLRTDLRDSSPSTYPLPDPSPRRCGLAATAHLASPPTRHCRAPFALSSITSRHHSANVLEAF